MGERHTKEAYDLGGGKGAVLRGVGGARICLIATVMVVSSKNFGNDEVVMVVVCSLITLIVIDPYGQ